jgi:hypothetical protein
MNLCSVLRSSCALDVILPPCFPLFANSLDGIDAGCDFLSGNLRLLIV